MKCIGALLLLSVLFSINSFACTGGSGSTINVDCTGTCDLNPPAGSPTPGTVSQSIANETVSQAGLCADTAVNLIIVTKFPGGYGQTYLFFTSESNGQASFIGSEVDHEQLPRAPHPGSCNPGAAVCIGGGFITITGAPVTYAFYPS